MDKNEETAGAAGQFSEVDNELRAMRLIIRALEALPQPGRERVVRYLAARFPIEP
jgi:hypothetical protein